MVLRIPVAQHSATHYGTLTRSGQPFQAVRVALAVVLLVLQPRPLLREDGLGCSRFARHYYGNLMLISFRRVTEMFQFTHYPLHRYGLAMQSPDITLEELPHSDSSGSSLGCSSPETFRRSPRPSSVFST